MTLKLKYGSIVGLILAASMASADTLVLKNGSQIKGKFLGGTEAQISFQVGSTVQKYRVADIVSLKFDSEGVADASAPQPQSSLPDNPSPVAAVEVKPANLTIRPGREYLCAPSMPSIRPAAFRETASRPRSQNP